MQCLQASRLYSDIVHYILRDGTSLDLFGILIVSMCVNLAVCVLFRTEALGPLMGSEDLCDAQFAGPVSVESIEVQSDHQGSLLLVFPCCHTGISWGRRCDKASGNSHINRNQEMRIPALKIRGKSLQISTGPLPVAQCSVKLS